MDERKMVEVVLPYLTRLQYKANKTSVLATEAVTSDGTRADLAIVSANRRHLEVVEAEPTFGRCFGDGHGFVQLARLHANYRWLAIPHCEWEAWDEAKQLALEQACKRLGVGLIFVYAKRGKQRNARVIVSAKRVKGDFLGYYPKLENQWRERYE